MSNRRVVALAVVLLALPLTGVAWAVLSARAERREIAALEQSIRANEAERDARRERDRAELARWKQEQDHAAAAADRVAPPPREVRPSDRERIDREVARWQQEERARDRAERERAEQAARAERERLEREAADREKAERERAEREKARAARRSRWTLKFQYAYGEAARLLAACGATVYVQEAGGKWRAYADPSKPDGWKPAAAREAAQALFRGDRADQRELVAELAGALKCDDSRGFAVVFPDEFLTDLEKKELEHRNRRPEDILETKFDLRIKDGKPEVRVADQKTIR